MSWAEMVKEFHAWTAALWPDDADARLRAKTDRLYRLLQRRVERLIRRRLVIDELRSHVGRCRKLLLRHEQEYREQLKELERLKQRLARLRARGHSS